MDTFGSPSVSPFESLNYVFSQTSTAVLPPERERRLSEQLWQHRRRVHLALLWFENPHLFSGEPPMPREHRTPITNGFARRLRVSERRARALVAEQPGFDLVRSELHQMDLLRDELFHRNLRLIAWVARGYLGKGLELPDLFQEGAISLLNSVERFDPARDVRLSTFASHAIRLGLIRALTDRGRAIRVPNYRMREVIETTKARVALLHRLGREPNTEELQSETGLKGDAVEELLPAIRPLLRFDGAPGGSEAPLSDFLSDTTAPSPFERCRAAERKLRASRAIARLPGRECKILTLRYGLGDADEHTFEEIGRKLGLSRERVRQLERSARAKLRCLLRDAG